MEIQKLPKIRFAVLRKVILVSFIISISFIGGYFLGLKGSKVGIKIYPKVTISRTVPEEVGTLDFSLFWKVWDTLHLKYFDKSKLIDSQMVYGAISGMVAAIGDPYTAFLPPPENKIVEEDLKGSFDGVGIQIGYRNKNLAVISPLPGSPAEKAGVLAGDYILAIKDIAKGTETNTQGITLNEAVQIIRGPKGTKVALTLLRDGREDPFTLELARDVIDVPSVVVKYYGDGDSIADVQILKFSAETQSEWEEKVAELSLKGNIKGIIIDVRNNPGGYMQAAVDLASDFLETGDVVVLEEGSQTIKQEYKVEKIGRFRTQKMVVLMNKGSASASEIFAGALKDHKRATIVGSVSFGKGTIQEPEQIDNGAGLHITIARWLTPSGFWVNDGGLKPDVEVEDKTDTEQDEQLDKALELLKI